MPNSAGMVRSCRPEIVTNIWPVFEARLRAAEGATSCNEHTSTRTTESGSGSFMLKFGPP